MLGLQSLVPGDPGDLSVLWRIVELCLPLHEECGTVTFSPRGEEVLEGDWSGWVAEIYAPILAPTLLSLQDFVSNARFTALLGADAALGSALPVRAARRSLEAGRRVLLDVRPPKGVRVLDHLRGAALNNPAVGHLATVFAARAHAFHVPAMQSSMAFLLAECVLGASGVGLVLSPSRTTELLAAAMHVNSPAAQLIAV